MMQYLRKYGFHLLVAFAVLFPFAFYSSDLVGRHELSLVEKITVALSHPFEAAIHGVASTVKGVSRDYVALYDAREQAKRFERESTRLKLQLQALSEVSSENSRLRQLLSLVQKSDLRFRSCEIVSVDPTFLFKNVRINCGEKDGVFEGMGVVAAEGVVGIVMRSTSGFSDVLLIVDPNSNLDVIVARNRRRGILAGNGSGGMIFKYSDRGTRVQVGDEVISSGLTGPFPGGLSVGKVSRIVGDGDSVTQTIEVEPSMNIYQVAEVLVLLQPSREIEVIRKVGGRDWLKRMLDSSASSRGG
jgi:rod shape-determining protein MreC